MSLFWYSLLCTCILSSCAIILKRKRELIALLLLFNPSLMFVLKMSSVFTSPHCIQVSLTLPLNIEAKTMNNWQSDLGCYCLQYKLTMFIGWYI